jgi:hypothetical protein
VLACGGSYARLCSFCFASLQLTVLVVLFGAHCVFSGGLDCSVRAHACSFAASALCSPDPFLHVALLVFCLNALYLWFLPLHAASTLLFAPLRRTQ